ncbi:MAG: 2OG-Fe(II) oxygenase [Mesonia hippocampi]|uniref:SM-20-related protein n=1 Tax=Mesonia hippocampi TaxID=1628250 RepID=A0A840EUF2_9FLAO|nr:SM-20-related protein [Mesonia hippocampi]
MNKELFEQLDFEENRLYEQIITDLSEQQYCVVDNFFTSEEVLLLRTKLLQNYKADAFKKSAIGNRTNELIKNNVRGDFILWINEASTAAAEKLFFQKINHLVAYLNRTCFMGILHKEFHYAVYPKGTFYQRHLDTFQNDSRRKLSVVCYLNDKDWAPENGGELVIYKEDQTAINLYPLPGRIVIFESQLLEHEVKEVKKGKRLSITGWLKTR